MLETEKWAKDRPFLIALLGPLSAASAQDISQGFKELKSRRLNGIQLPIPPLIDWFRLYRSHREIDNFTKEMFSVFLSSGAEYVEFADSIMGELRLYRRGKIEQRQFPPSPEKIAAIKEYLGKILADFSQDLANDFSDAAPDPAEHAAFKRFNEGKELVASFFMLVHVPCWILYQTSPTRLYRQAKAGNVDAIEKLLRLDPLMLHDPIIGRRLLKIRYDGNLVTYRSLLEAPLKSPGKFSKKSIAAGMAGFLSALSLQLDKPLTEPEIKRLYDAVAKDRSKDLHAIDDSIPETPETFAKAIYRKRQPWLDAMKPDKKI